MPVNVKKDLDGDSLNVVLSGDQFDDRALFPVRHQPEDPQSLLVDGLAGLVP